MSKNPPKPNTSPDHVKETAEPFTRPSSARPEHGPSHTEAQERLWAELRDVEAMEGHSVLVKAADLRTVLDTPTQGTTSASDRVEAQLEQVLVERDDAEQALSQAFYLVTGRSPEWSNLFHHKEALEEIEDACALLRRAATPPDTPTQEGVGLSIPAPERGFASDQAASSVDASRGDL